MRVLLWALAVTGLFTSTAVAGPLEPGKTGDELLRALRARFSPRRTLGYRQARQVMFSRLDNQDGFVRLVYTGHAYRTSSIPNPNVVNTEHTWPQSKFLVMGTDSAKRCDLHHLYPTFNRVNGERGSKPFEEIPDQGARAWWRAPQAEYDVPAGDRDEYSESTHSSFEPREDHKGNVARSLAYFYMVYGDTGIEDEWFLDRLETFSQWHAQDPVDLRERARSAGIAEIQGNQNPFVLDPTAFDRAFGDLRSARRAD